MDNVKFKVYTSISLIDWRRWKMTISEQIKVLCVRCDISVAELARRVGKSPQNMSSKLKRGSFTMEDLDDIAEAVGVTFERHFVLNNGDKV